MLIRIVDVDFARSSVVLEVTPDHPEGPLGHIGVLASKCKALGLNNIRLYYDEETSVATARRLRDLCRNERLAPPEPTPPSLRPGASVRSGHLPKTHALTTSKPVVEYQMSFGHMENAVSALTNTVMLIGESADLDPRSQFMLRLCVYELIVNTVEHGTFDVAYPEVSVRVAFTGEKVVVSYADNATVFMADETSVVDMVEEQIKSSSKRGLGLYLLNNICNNWKYERLKDWNVTTFSLDLNCDKTPVTER